MIILEPTQCNICSGVVKYISNDKIYGKKYGSGFCYHCTNCGAYVGTHKRRPREALGLLANREMRILKIACHETFDKFWKSAENPKKKRQEMYSKLATELQINVNDCHFGYFDLNLLTKSIPILKRWERRGVKL